MVSIILNTNMQYILSEEEYNKLIHKSRIKIPIIEFVDKLNKMVANGHHFNPLEVTLSKEAISNAIQTLNIKLDL